MSSGEGPWDGAADSGADEHAIGMDEPTEAAERAYEHRLTWGWRLVAVGLVTTPSALAFVTARDPLNSAFLSLLVAPLAIGPMLVGSAMIQYADQTVGRFSGWGRSGRYNQHEDTLQSSGEGVFLGLLIFSAGAGIGVFALSVVL